MQFHLALMSSPTIILHVTCGEQQKLAGQIVLQDIDFLYGDIYTPLSTSICDVQIVYAVLFISVGKL